MAGLDYDDIIDLFFSAGLSDPYAAAEYLQVNITTVKRWRRGEVSPPYAVIELLRMMSGLFPRVPARLADSRRNDGGFDGWQFRAGLLFNPDDSRGYSAADIRCIPNLYDQLRGLRVDKREMSAEIARLRDDVIRLTPDRQAVADSNVIKFPTQKRA